MKKLVLSLTVLALVSFLGSSAFACMNCVAQGKMSASLSSCSTCSSDEKDEKKDDKKEGSEEEHKDEKKH